MRKIIILAFAILLISCASAEILLQQQPGVLYNLGDTISLPVKITTLGGLQETFRMSLICNNQEREFYMNDVDLLAGEEQSLTAVLRLSRERVGGLTGDCLIKATLGEEYILTNEFYISNFINIELPVDKVEFKPKEEIIINGKATKESLAPVNGFMELSIVNDIKTLNFIDTVNKGYFSINFSLPEDMPAGAYLTKVRVYESDINGETTNSGFVDYNILVLQVPTNLEIMFEESEVEPGTNMRVKTILHDQSGEQIESSSTITIKDENNKILEQIEKPTDEFLEYAIVYNQPPAEWTIFAVSNQLTNEATFEIKEKQDVKAELINKTLTITNIGNILYNNTISVKIGDEYIILNVTLEIDESQNFILSAPDGEYEVEVTSQGESKVSESVMLTGKTIGVKEAAEGVVALVRHPFVWIFIIAVLGFIAFIVYKKGYQRTFVGYVQRFKKKGKPQSTQQETKHHTRKKPIIKSQNKAELSLSIKGDKQNTSVVCVHVKNLKDLEAGKGGAEDTLQKINDVAEENQATTYENQDNLFFILSPATTKTFKNEKTALNIAQKIKSILTQHNKLAKQKIDFGISLNYGTIVAKKEKDSLKFMSMGTLITAAKKIASIADKDILLGEKIKEKLIRDIRTEKQIKNNIPVFSLKEVRGERKDINKQFIGEFMKRMERGEKKTETNKPETKEGEG